MKTTFSLKFSLIIFPLLLIGLTSVFIGYGSHLRKEKQENELKIITAQTYQTNLNQTIDSFLFNLISAESYYQTSCNLMVGIIKLAAEMEQRGDSRYILRVTFKETNLSNITKKAQESYFSYKESIDFFDKLNSDTNNLISREFKESFVEFGQILESNIMFCNNMDEGNFTNESLNGWSRKLLQSKAVLAMLDIESKKLLSYKK